MDLKMSANPKTANLHLQISYLILFPIKQLQEQLSARSNQPHLITHSSFVQIALAVQNQTQTIWDHLHTRE